LIEGIVDRREKGLDKARTGKRDEGERRSLAAVRNRKMGKKPGGGERMC